VTDQLSLGAVAARVADIQTRLAALSGAPSGSGAAFEKVLTGMSSGSGMASSQSTALTTAGGSAAVQDAERYLGVPYRWGGTDPATGLDCSGLVQRVFGDLGITMPRVAADQARQGTPVTSLADARPGDLVTFGSPAEHIGIYVGDGMMIDAPHTGAAVRIEPVGAPTEIRRVIDGGATPDGRYAGSFATASARYGIPANVLAAVANVESGGDPTAVSPAGAQGLMQLMPSTAAALGVDPMVPDQAIDGAARLLSSDLRQFGSLPLALAAYNAGAGAVQRAGGIPPYPETEAYVQKVLAAAGEAP
jgi:peptidoglycan DL-endopeptidase CwlO